MAIPPMLQKKRERGFDRWRHRKPSRLDDQHFYNLAEPGGDQRRLRFLSIAPFRDVA
ncbi:MAG: hypothetical protein ACREAC_32135 [Blastocatellia bacterium]